MTSAHVGSAAGDDGAGGGDTGGLAEAEGGGDAGTVIPFQFWNTNSNSLRLDRTPVSMMSLRHSSREITFPFNTRSLPRAVIWRRHSSWWKAPSCSSSGNVRIVSFSRSFV